MTSNLQEALGVTGIEVSPLTTFFPLCSHVELALKRNPFTFKIAFYYILPFNLYENSKEEYHTLTKHSIARSILFRVNSMEFKINSGENITL